MGFASLAVVMLAALLGPLVAAVSRWQVPVVVCEVLLGVALGGTGLGYLDPTDDRFAFLAALGFALVMFVAGAHVPVRDRRLLQSLRTGVGRAALAGAVAAVLAVVVGPGAGHRARRRVRRRHGVVLRSPRAPGLAGAAAGR